MDSSTLIILLVIIMVLLIIVYPMARDGIFRMRANREGVIVEATITHKRRERSRLGAHYSLEYTYLTYERLEYVKQREYEAIEEGQQIKIVYLYSNPRDARIKGKDSSI